MNLKFTTRPYLPVLVVSIVLFISIFLPWYSVNILGTHIGSLNGARNGGILTLLMSLAGIGLAFLDVPKTRALLTIGAGLFALLGVIIALAQLSGFSMGFGMIIGLLASMALVAIGFLDYRKINLPAKAQPDQSPPPAPPAPPTPA